MSVSKSNPKGQCLLSEWVTDLKSAMADASVIDVVRIWVTTLLALGVTQVAVAQMSRTSDFGSTLSVQGQVIGPHDSPTLNSTIDLSGGDAVRWTSYLSSKLPSPATHAGVLTLPPGHRWIPGSFKAPQGVTPQWQVSGQWQAREPAPGQLVSAVKWAAGRRYTVEPPQDIVDVLDMSGVGDGYRVIPYKDRLFVVNHHGALGNRFQNPLKCRMAATGLSCPDWPNTGVDFRTTPGAILDGQVYPDSTGFTTQNPVEGLNEATGELFVVVGGRFNGRLATGIVCTNLDTRTSCGSWEIGRTFGRAISFNQIGNKYYAVNEQSEFVCFDVAKRTFCEGTESPSRRLNYGLMAGSNWANSVALGHRLFFMANLNQAGGTRAYCHDAETGRPCKGWTVAGVLLRGEGGGNPWLNADGSARGVCSRAGDCVDVNGINFKASKNYIEFFEERRSGWGYRYRNISAIKGSKVYAGSVGLGRVGPDVGCFDTAANQRCGSWPTSDADPYTSRFHPKLPNCVMVIGHKSIANILDVTTGGKCSSTEEGHAVVLLMDPLNDNFQCDAGRARVDSWGKLRFSRDLKWGSGGIKGMKVRLLNKDGQLLPAAMKPEREFAKGSYEMDIGSGPNAVPFAQYPVLKIELTPVFFSTNAGPLSFSAELSYVGDPVQVCASSTAPAEPDCQTQTKVVINSLQVGGAAKETLSAATLLSPGGLSSGYAAVSTPTSPRAILSDLGPRDPKTHVLQGRWALDKFSGDLWAFGLNASGEIDASSYLSAQAGTESASTRPMFMAKPGTSGFLPVQYLEWGNLSASQQDSLNHNHNGLQDQRGAGRVSYLRGSDGGFRARGGKTLGPVINSGPAMLQPSATLGLSERHYPGYSAYRASMVRPHPVAIYGGNDGAMHAYEVRPGGLKEAWTFVPNVMLSRAAHFSDPDLAGIRANPYFVDNVPMVGHVNTGVGTGWRAVAVQTFGRGARAIAALDVSHVDLRKGAGVLFEYNSTTHPDLNDLGYIISQPLINNALLSEQIVQIGERPAGGSEVSKRRAAVLVGNGIASNDDRSVNDASAPGRAVLYAFYLDQSGEAKWQRWAVDELWSGASAAERQTVARDNGLSTPTPVDTNGDGVVDLVYAGDVQGNLWRFDLSRSLQSPSVTRLFKTQADQPITQAPFVTSNPAANGCGAGASNSDLAAKRCWQVVFSTGAAISPLIGTPNVKTQSIYSVLDKGQGQSLQPSQLSKIPYAINQVVKGVEYRALVPTQPNYAKGAMGWTIDLQGFEHGVGAPRLQPTGLVMFSSIRPATPDRAVNVCIGPRSWLNEVDPINGSSAVLPFDVNGDGSIDDQDRIQRGNSLPLPPTAMAVSGAQFGPPAVLQASSTSSQQMSLLLPSLGQDTSQSESWSGGTAKDGSTAAGSNSTSLRHSKRSKLGRMSWREVF